MTMGTHQSSLLIVEKPPVKLLKDSDDKTAKIF